MSLSKDHAGLTEEMKTFILEGGVISCSDLHEGTCLTSALLRTLNTVPKCWKYYLPIHLIPFLIFKRKKVMQNPVKTISTAAYNYIKSILFVSFYVGICKYVLCKMKNFRNKVGAANPTIAASMACSALLLESEGRRQEISLFIFPKALETAWRLLRKRSMVSDIPGWELIVFGIAMGILNFYFQHDVSLVILMKGISNQINLSISMLKAMGHRLMKYAMIILISLLIQFTLQLNIGSTLQLEDYSEIHLSNIKWFQSDFHYGKVQMNLSLNASLPYQLVFFPNQDSEEFRCFKYRILDCFKKIKNNTCESNQSLAQVEAIHFKDCTLIHLSLNLSVSNQHSLNPIFILLGAYYLNHSYSAPQTSISLKYNFDFLENDDNYKQTIILSLVLVVEASILTVILCICKQRYKKLRKQILYAQNVDNKLKHK